MPSKKIREIVEPGATYHIYNRGNNYQNVFFGENDYLLFLEKIKMYLLSYCSIFAFALLPNHYHLLLRVNENLKQSEFNRQFLKLILSYTNKINFREKRNGNLFLPHFRRIRIVNEEYLKRLVYYINYNPEKHEITDDFKTYKFSSYRIFMSEKPSNLAREEVFSWFDGWNGFIEYHNYLHDSESIKKLTFEDE